MADALAAERELMAPLKAAADLVIDTSRPVAARPAPSACRPLRGGAAGTGRSTVVSFAYRHGLPREADLVFDVRFLRNPHYVEALRPETGPRRGRAGAHPCRSGARAVRERSAAAARLPLLPRYQGEGKSYLTIAFGCTGGRHRSVFLAELDCRLARGDWLGGHDRAS